MKSVAQMVSFFEKNSKKTKPVKATKTPAKLTVPIQFKQRIIMPVGGIPKYYGASQVPKQQPKSPKLVKNPEIAKEPEKIDKNKIKENMENMKALLEKKQIHKRPFKIEPCLNSNRAAINFNEKLQMFQPSPMRLVYNVKTIRNVRKKTKNTFHE